MKFLVDACLSEELAHQARAHGHLDSSHLRWIGKADWQDHNLLPVILEGDWVFVTRNSYDFRGPAAAPGSKGEYSKVELHAGLICLNGPVGMDLDLQLELFSVAMDDLALDSDLVNKVLEVTLRSETQDIEIIRYDLPD
jgi:Domain of unknown function (DUF5615)